MFKRNVLGLLVILVSCAQAEVVVQDRGSYMDVQTEYGFCQVHEPVLCVVLRCPALERLKHVRQYGVTYYARQEKQFTRYEHSVGVFFLLRRFDASISEQIAGLLHDVSHTVFSHVGDLVFDRYFNKYSYQDDIHEWYLEQSGTMAILNAYDYASCCSTSAKKTQRMLEQDRPDICMDRIEYLLRGGLAEDLITQRQALEILDDLYFENNQWVFKSKKHAKTLACIALSLSEHVFGSAWNAFIYKNASDALKQAVAIGLLTKDDIHFSVDQVAWHKLATSTDQAIKIAVDNIVHYKDHMQLADEQSCDMHLKGKCLGIDPWVQCPDGLQRLSHVDAAFAAEYKRVHELIARGWYLKVQ